MLNKCCFQGRFAKDPEMRNTTSGKAVATFTLAVERRYRKEGQNNADFLDFVAWERTAEFICRYFAKGQMAVVETHAQKRTYQDKNGNNRSVVEFLVDDISFCGPKAQDSGSGQPYAAPAPAYSQPYQQAPAPAAPPAYPQSNYAPPPVHQQSFADVPPAGSNEDFALIEDEGDLPF